MERNTRGPSLTVDGILERDGAILLVRRGVEPFRGDLALPGGFVEIGETVEQAVIREFEEETGIITSIDHMLGVYSDPRRDPRRHTVSVVFVLRQTGGELCAGDDAADVTWADLSDPPGMAFDHATIIDDYRKEKEIRGRGDQLPAP